MSWRKEGTTPSKERTASQRNSSPTHSPSIRRSRRPKNKRNLRLA
jgi:hypothetical protein